MKQNVRTKLKQKLIAIGFQGSRFGHNSLASLSRESLSLSLSRESLSVSLVSLSLV